KGAPRSWGLIEQQECGLLHAGIWLLQSRDKGRGVGKVVKGVKQRMFEKAIRMQGQSLPDRRQGAGTAAPCQRRSSGQADMRIVRGQQPAEVRRYLAIRAQTERADGRDDDFGVSVVQGLSQRTLRRRIGEP